MKRIFEVKITMFKPSGKYYCDGVRMMVAKDCGSKPTDGALSQPWAYISDLIKTIRNLDLADKPIVDGTKGSTGWTVVIQGEGIVPHAIKL